MRQVDIDGHANYSQVLKIQLNDDDIVSVFYNNGKNSIQLAFNKKQDNVRLKLLGANGQLIRSASTTNNITVYTFELPPLATGMYMLQLINKNLAYTKKIFLEAAINHQLSVRITRSFYMIVTH